MALVQVDEPAAALVVEAWSMAGRRVGINHIAITYADRDQFLQQLAHLKAEIPFLVRGDHGMTHSVYIADPDGNGIEVLYEMPAAVWEGDVNAALNYFKPLALEGEEAMGDDTDFKRFEPATG